MCCDYVISRLMMVLAVSLLEDQSRVVAPNSDNPSLDLAI